MTKEVSNIKKEEAIKELLKTAKKIKKSHIMRFLII